jgi:hypothetical protein
VQRGLAAAQVGVVEHRQVIVHKARAVDEFQRGGGGIGKRGPVVTAGARDRQKDRRADPRAAGRRRIVQRGGKPGRRAHRAMGALPAADGGCDRSLDPVRQGHSPPPRICHL